MAAFGDLTYHEVDLKVSFPALPSQMLPGEAPHLPVRDVRLRYAGHESEPQVSPEVYLNFGRKAQQMTQLFETLLPGEANFGLEPSWTQIYPYQSLAWPGDTLHLEVRMTNFMPRSARAEVSLAPPAGWSSDPDSVALELPPQGQACARFQVRIPPDYVFRYPRAATAADVTFEGRRLGQITEALVEQAGQRPNGERHHFSSGPVDRGFSGHF